MKLSAKTYKTQNLSMNVSNIDYFGWHAQKMNQATLAIRMRENADYNNSEYGHFLRSV